MGYGYSINRLYRVRPGSRANAGRSRTLGGSPPAAPSDLVATQTDEETVALAWVDNSFNEVEFEIERAVEQPKIVQLTFPSGGTAAQADYFIFESPDFSESRAFWLNIDSNGTEPTGADYMASFQNPVRVDIASSDTAAQVATKVMAAGMTGGNFGGLTLADITDPAATRVNAVITLTFVVNGDTYVARHNANDSGNGSIGLTVTQEGSIDFTALDTAAADEESYNDTTVSVDSEYTYRIRAVNDDGASAYATSDPITISPNPPSNAVAAQTDIEEVTLTWDDNSSAETGFDIDRKEDAGSFSFLTSVAANEESYVDTNVDVNIAYTYRLRAKGNHANSAYATSNAETPGYVEGYPGFASLAASGPASLQWRMDEASGNITDEVASRVLTAEGTPTYNVAASGLFSRWGPGITCASGHFGTNSALTEANLGTDDAVINYKFKTTSTGGGKYVVRTYHATTGLNGFSIAHNYDIGRIELTIAGAVDIVFGTFTGLTMNDGVEHTVRILLDRSGNATLYFDGNLNGDTVNISTLDGLAVNTTAFHLGAYNNGDSYFNGTIYEYRQSVGTLTANSGGPNGG